MKHKDMVEYFRELVLEHYPDGLDGVAVPPPSFTAMKAEFVTINPDDRIVEVKFPVLEDTLNPFGNMQGGMIAAAVDNTIGPLSMLTGPINFTRDLSLKYRNPVKGSFDFIIVKAVLKEIRRRQLFFKAEVRGPDRTLLVTAESMNWIIG